MWVSTVTVHSNSSRKRAFRKHSSNRRNLKTPALPFNVEGKHFVNGAFRKRRCENNDDDFPARVFLKNKSKITGNSYVLNFLRRSVDGKPLMHFQSENPVSKFLSLA